MNQNELAILIENVLRRGKRIYQGRVLGASNAGGKVSVEMSAFVPGFGTVINAIALNDCIGGTATVFLADDGRWLALSTQSNQPVKVSQLASFRRRRNKLVALVKHNLRVLVITKDDTNGDNKIVLYAGSESRQVEKIWEDPTPSEHTYLFDSQYYIRIDNSDIEKEDGWVVTGLWADNTPRTDGQRLINNPAIAKSIDPINYYETPIYDLNSLKISGAYFYTLTYNDRYNPFVSNFQINGTYNKTERRNNENEITQTVININFETNEVAGNLLGGNFSNTPPTEFFNPGSGFANYYVVPSTAIRTGNSYEFPFFTGSYSRSLNNTFNSDNKVFNADTAFAEYRTSFNTTIDGTESFSSNQKFQFIYKGELEEVNSTEQRKYSFSATASSKGYEAQIKEVNFSENSTATSSITPVTINMLPIGGVETTFSENYDYSLNESGEFVSIADEYIFSLGVSTYLFPYGNQNKVYSKVGFITIGYEHPANNLIFSSHLTGRDFKPIADILSPGLIENRKRLNHISMLTSIDGLNGIVYIQDIHEQNINVLENYERTYNRNGNIGVDIISVRKGIRGYEKYSEGCYFYKLNEITNEVSKQLIEFSGKKVIVYNYLEDYTNENPINQNTISTKVYDHFTSFGDDVPPNNLFLNQVITFNSSRNSYHTTFNSGQTLEFEYNNGISQICYGMTIVTNVSISSVSMRITELREFTTEEKEKYNLEFLFGGQDYVSFIVQSLGGNILNYLDEYSGAANITISGDTAYNVQVIDYHSLYNAQPYYIFLDSYKFVPYNNGSSVYLKRLEPEFIQCPAIEIDNLENVIFAYSD